MSKNLNKKEIEKFSRQIILKNIGAVGQKKILSSKVLIVGMGGLGCPVAEFLTRSGIGTLGIADHDTVSLSNIHRQSLYNEKDINQSKVKIAKKKLNKINPKTKINIFNLKLNKTTFEKIIKNYDYIVDGTDNFESKFLINDLSLKYKKFLVTGAISKFDGHIFTFNFTNKKDPCLRCFYQEDTISDEILNCEYEGILGTVAGIIGTLQANEVLKKILNIGQNLNGYILILDLLNLNFRKAKINKRKKCLMQLIVKKIYIVFFLLFFTHISFADEIFVSLKKNKVNVRYGPSFESDIKYVYKKINLPLKQIDKKENFRRIIDLKNNSGWIHISQLKKSNSVIATKDKVLFKKPTSFAKPIAQIKEGRLLIIEKCEQNWCKVTSEEFEGWIKTDNIWGLN